MKKLIYLLILSTLCILKTEAKPYNFSEKELNRTPPRIIRTCCAFGSEIQIVAVPFYRYTETTGFDKIGPHTYLGNSEERNGILYTKRGGFIDLGHLRDIADWTAYLYSYLSKNRNLKIFEFKLGYEGGEKKLKVSIPDYFSENDIILLAGRIAYDISVWHEIATWFDVKSVPLVPEKFSSFSVEDCYSNLLGVFLSIDAIKSDLPYEEAMTSLLNAKLKEIGVLNTEKETLDALEKVRNIWWTRDIKLPSPDVMILRQTDVYDKLVPMLIADNYYQSSKPYILSIPDRNEKGEVLNQLYEFKIEPNFLFPFKRIFPGEPVRTITQKDFKVMIERVNYEIEQDERHDYYSKVMKIQNHSVKSKSTL